MLFTTYYETCNMLLRIEDAGIHLPHCSLDVLQDLTSVDHHVLGFADSPKQQMSQKQTVLCAPWWYGPLKRNVLSNILLRHMFKVISQFLLGIRKFIESHRSTQPCCAFGCNWRRPRFQNGVYILWMKSPDNEVSYYVWKRLLRIQ